MLGWF